MSQVLNLKDSELDQLAKYMGHDIRVHPKFYRLPDDVMQTAKVGKILMAMEKGDMALYKGKSLDEIDIAIDEGKYFDFLSFFIYCFILIYIDR